MTDDVGGEVDVGPGVTSIPAQPLDETTVSRLPGPRPRVLHVVQPTVDGVARHVAQLVGVQVGLGWPVTVASPPGGDLRRQVTGTGASWTPWPAGREPGLNMVAEFLRLRSLVGRVRPDVVHLHASKASTVGRLLLRGRLPTIVQPQAWSFRAVDGRMRQVVTAWERLAARWSHSIICASQLEFDLAVEAGIDGPLVVVQNSIDLTEFAPPEAGSQHRARADLGLSPGPLVVCVGRLCRQKGQDVLLDAWPLVTSRVPSARLVLVGDGPDQDSIAARASDDVILAGRQANYADWLIAADVVALPSRWEGQSLTLLASMACGRSVVASDVEGMQDALATGTPEAAGALVAPEDRTALADALVT
ncbi:MAG: glycosyltransferase, partial [Acidimicrobiales bacterium]